MVRRATRVGAMNAAQELAVGIGGIGAIGKPLAEALAAGVPGLRLAAISGRDTDKAAHFAAGLGGGVEAVTLPALAERAEVVVECAPAAVFDDIAEPAIDAGRIFVPLSVGAMLERATLVERARESGARIVIPSGAILGLDAVKAAAEGEIRSIKLVTRKPPRALAGAPYLAERGIELDGLDAPLLVFSGSAGEGARHFPANVNVGAALSLAGVGPQRTELELWADPALERNTHTVTVDSDSSRFTLSIESLPSPDNPRTGLITYRSALATLRGLTATLRVGT